MSEIKAIIREETKTNKQQMHNIGYTFFNLLPSPILYTDVVECGCLSHLYAPQKLSHISYIVQFATNLFSLYDKCDAEISFMQK